MIDIWPFIRRLSVKVKKKYAEKYVGVIPDMKSRDEK